MGKKVYFLDSIKQSDGNYNNVYGVDDINAIVSNLVGAGVAPFPSGDTYDVSELNSLTSELVGEGTSFDGLKVSFADNKIHIAQGIGYFENGATIVVDSEGEELDYNVAETLYVYAEYNQALNTCGFYASESEPAKGSGIYTLMLATIAADGTVTDRRAVAQSKVATLGKNVFEYVWRKTSAEYTSFSTNITLVNKEVDLSKFSHLVSAWAYDGVKYTYKRVPVETLLTGESVKLTFDWGGSGVYAQVTGSRLKIYIEIRTNTSVSTYAGTEIYLC